MRGGRKARSRPARRWSGRRRRGNVAAEASYGDAAAVEDGFCRGGACHRARAAQPAPDRHGDGAARAHRRSRGRPHHALHAEPDADRRARSAGRGVRREADDFRIIDRRHRRRLRHEDRPYARGRARLLRGAQARPAGEVARRSQRRISSPRTWARDQHYKRGAGARRARAHPRAATWRRSATSARCRSAPRRSSRCMLGRRCRPPSITCRWCTTACSAVLTQHHGDRRLSRRRPAGGATT